MSKKEKLFKRFLELKKDITSNEIIKVMELMGYKGEFPRKGSSHCTFRKKNRYPVTVPVHEPIKITYNSLSKGEKTHDFNRGMIAH